MENLFTGQRVKIVGAKNSGPTEQMFDMIGEIHTVRQIHSNPRYYSVNGYAWNRLDLEPVSDKLIIKAEKFDVKNIVR